VTEDVNPITKLKFYPLKKYFERLMYMLISSISQHNEKSNISFHLLSKFGNYFVLLVYLFTLTNMYEEATAQGQSGFVRTSSSNNNNTNQIPYDDRCNSNQTLIPVDCLRGDYSL
jgi:hypothetical protein